MSNNILVYSSIGDVSTFFPLWKHHGLSYAFNYYGQDESRRKIIETNCDFFTNSPGTKFNLFSKLYDSLPIFDYYVIIDDDINLKGEDITRMVETMQIKNCGVSSPAHSPRGRISWPIMKPVLGNKFRKSNFVEMTVVIFSHNELKKFLTAYNPYKDQMIGWGIDHIIHSVCKKPFLIFDSIVIVNPTNEQKGIELREIQTYINGRDPQNMWKQVLADSNNNFIEYKNGH